MLPPWRWAEAMRRHVDPGIFEPEELAFLQQAFDCVCEENDIDPTSEAGEKVAKTLISLYQSGVSDLHQLLSVVSARAA
jgi:hypothetical protein